MGIHGEPGVNREEITTAGQLAKKLLGRILEDHNFAGKDAALMVNGLGGTPLMELYILFGEAEKILRDKGVKIYRSYVGNYMTSLEMAGCSLTLLELDDELKKLLDALADTAAFKV